MSVGNIEVQVIEPCLRVSILRLTRWNMKSRVFVLNNGWNSIAHDQRNGLAQDDVVQVWHFRAGGRVRFAIVKSIIRAAKESTASSFPYL